MKTAMLISLALVSALALAGVGVIAFSGQQAVSKRFEVNATVRVDDQVLTGAAVWEAEVRPETGGDFTVLARRVRGEAIPFTISPQEVLFLLRSPDDGISSLAYGDFITGCVQARLGEDLLEKLAAFEGECIVDDRPQLVLATGDPSNPTVLFDASGPVATGRAEIVALSVKTTSEPLSRGLLKTYPWIARLPEPSQGMISDGRLYRHDFSTE
jgi:hypothetical protein